MKKREQIKENNMFPINYNGKLWHKKDCDDVFLAFYNNSYSLTTDCSVYMMAGDYVYPDGMMIFNDDDF